jgi:nanoRNase/pAp phosphatase (c-di-AMP/oligoRNAs hydrolase)
VRGQFDSTPVKRYELKNDTSQISLTANYNFMDTTKAIELIEKAQHIAMLIPSSPDLDILASAEALAVRLKGQGKQIGFMAPVSKKNFPNDTFLAISSSPLLPREFIVSLNTSTSPISQLRYEKTENSTDIIFSPKESPILKESISFREGKTLCDLCLCLGVQNIEKLEGISTELTSEIPVLNLDISGDNGRYGEVNLVDPERSSLGELTYDFLTNIRQEPLDKKSATLLLAGIIFKTNHFSYKTTADTLLCASELMRLEANLMDAEKLAKDAKSPALLQLQGRAMVRSKFDEEKGVLWSFVTAEDFEKTGRTADDIPSLLNHVQKEFPPHLITAMLCQTGEGGGIAVTLAGSRTSLEALEVLGAGKFQSPYLRISSSFESFREAEEIVGSLLSSLAESA